VKYCTSCAQCARFAVACGYFLFAGRVGVVYTHYRGHAEYFAMPLITKKTSWSHIRTRACTHVRARHMANCALHIYKSRMRVSPRKHNSWTSTKKDPFCVHWIANGFCILYLYRYYTERKTEMRAGCVFISAAIYIPDISPFLVCNMCICKHVYVWHV
jgi:hypothetical protein